MNSIKKLLPTILLFALVFSGCDGQEDSLIEDRFEDNPVPSSIDATQGSADFSKYVAIGNSTSAGFMDAALYNGGQENSMPALLARQLKIAAENDGATFDSFDQPDINSENGFNFSVPNPDPGTGAILGRFELDTSIPGPVPTIGEPIGPFTGDKAALNNFGVPGILVGQLLTPFTGGPADPVNNPAFNPFYQRFASNPGSSTILQDAIAAQPTFFTLWIGNNDVLGYALSGASNEAIFTSEADFNAQFNATVASLIANPQANGVVITIPPILALPFFQAVTYDAITLDEATASQLNQGFAGFNAALDAIVANLGHDPADADRRRVSYSAGSNPILVIDEELEDLGPKFDQLLGAGAISQQQRAALVPFEQSRPLEPGELVLLTAGAVLGTEADGDNSVADTPIGVAVPLGFDLATGALSGDQFYLSLPEQGAIQARSNAFNTIIATAAAQNSDRLALYDTNSGFPGNPNTEIGAFADLFGVDGSLGIEEGGVTLLPDFSPNGVFSTDGVHPNPQGNALLVNEIIGVIEENFGATIPEINVFEFRTVILAQ